MAQLGARFNGIEEVRGSNPLRSTNNSPTNEFGSRHAKLTPSANHSGKELDIRASPGLGVPRKELKSIPHT